MIVCPFQKINLLEYGRLTVESPLRWHMNRKSAANVIIKNTGPARKYRPVVVFKCGGSGSTWFDTLLSSHPDIDFRKEAQNTIFDKENDDDATSLRKMTSFLECETGLCGFSIAPDRWATFIEDWGDFLSSSNALLIVFMRTNAVKRVLSLKKKKQDIKKIPIKCRGKGGSSLLLSATNDTDCVVTGKRIHVERGRIESSIFVQTWQLIKYAMKTKHPFQLVTYEGMQQNVSETFHHIAQFTDWPLDNFNWKSHVTTIKATSENLSEVIENYDELLDAFHDNNCILEMLKSEPQQLFPLCYDSKVEKMFKKFKKNT